ncbi:MAG: methylenetetrahydromethanopterin dehydrogenase, partial [Theionarchaea archaeon]|nr:methylenetetrahydromethanopterin dehydrogenase [Theionarchaea archaeon]
MKKILVYLSNEPQPSLFDLIVAYDSDVDVVLPYGNVSKDDITDMVYGCIFTRRPKKLINTAILIGGSDSDLADDMMKKASKTFFGDFRVSIMADPNGNSTTSAATVAKIKDKLTDLTGMKSVVLAGTGPVGERVSVLLNREGSSVILTSRKQEKAEGVCQKIKEKYDRDITPMQVSNDEECLKAVRDADIVVGTGKAGIQLISKEIWMQCPSIKVLADVNAYPPAGIEGVDVGDDGKEMEGKYLFGAVAIGDIKTKGMRDVIRRMYEEKGAFMTLEKIYDIT